MVENFKLQALDIKRQLKISIYLPKGYHECERDYPLIYTTDGQMMFSSLDDDRKEFDLPELLDSNEVKCIVVGIHAPKNNLWRISELNPYYIKDETDVDPAYSINFCDYIVNKLHAIIKLRYRVSDFVNIMGFAEGGLQALYSIYKYDLFSNAGIFSPTLYNSEKYLEFIDKNIKKDKGIFLFYGGADNKDYDNHYELIKCIDKNKLDKSTLAYEDEEKNDSSSWKNHLIEYINFIMQR